MSTNLRTSGKRKTSVAKIKLFDGTGDVSYNGLLINNLKLFHKLSLLEPIRIYEDV